VVVARNLLHLHLVPLSCYHRRPSRTAPVDRGWHMNHPGGPRNGRDRGLSQDPEPEDVQDSPVAETKPKSGQRQQPKRKKRAKTVPQGDGEPGPTKRPSPVKKTGPVKKLGTQQEATADGDA
jgi:hypothetical protein